MEIDKWINGYKARALPKIDGKRIYFDVQFYNPWQSIEKPPVWDKTVYITDNEAGRRLVFEFTDTFVGYVAKMQLPNNYEVTVTT